jgi:hypothetical protein
MFGGNSGNEKGRSFLVLITSLSDGLNKRKGTPAVGEEGQK